MTFQFQNIPGKHILFSLLPRPSLNKKASKTSTDKVEVTGWRPPNLPSQSEHRIILSSLPSPPKMGFFPVN
jgi:hypothetical protein